MGGLQRQHQTPPTKAASTEGIDSLSTHIQANKHKFLNGGAYEPVNLINGRTFGLSH